MTSVFAFISLPSLCKGLPNGLRYPRWVGRRDAVRLEKCSGVEKGLESRQNPQRRVHALLAGVYGIKPLFLQWLLPVSLIITFSAETNVLKSSAR